jgi:hypothetical protein
MIDIIDKAPELDEIHAPSVIHLGQNHIFYMAYIESHYPEINIKDLVSADFQFVSLATSAYTRVAFTPTWARSSSAWSFRLASRCPSR